VNDGREGPASGTTDRQDVPSELKAIEARFATLAPRDDRLQRERLFFLAGQASAREAIGDQRITAPRWVWPASLAAMTTVAATLFVMLLVQSEPAVVERVVYVPAQAAPVKTPAETNIAEGAGQRDDGKDARAASVRDAVSYPRTATHLPHRRRLPAAGPQFRLFDHLLAEVPYSHINQEIVSSDSDTPASRQVLSRRLLDELLERSTPSDSPSDCPATQNPGAKT